MSASCVLRIELDEDLPEMADNPAETEAAKEQKKKDRGARETKTITVETYASILTGPASDVALLPTSSRRSPSEEPSDTETIKFFFGNPLVEVTKGILHLYKENEPAEDAKILCLLAVPGTLDAKDLLAFVAPSQKDILHVRVLRDGSLDHYMALIMFRTAASAREFSTSFDGCLYSSLEPSAICRVVWVSRVEWGKDGAAAKNGGSVSEVPTCAVCLERLDESVAVLSVQCAHAFHAACVQGSARAACPVCRCHSTPRPPTLRCTHCQNAEDAAENLDDTKDSITGVAEGLLDEAETGALWICLICGHIGCSRYERGHAAKHFLASNHTYALQMGSNRVWDYAGDRFVHRLVQNKADGKLVASGEDDKDAVLHYTQLLAHQLQEHDHTLATLESQHSAECEALKSRATEAEDTAKRLREEVDTLTKENKALEKKLHHVTTKLSTLQSELSEERSLAAALAANQAAWQANAQAKEDEFTKVVADLREQLRDVMFYVEARSQLSQTSGASQDEIQEAEVTVAPPPKPRRKKR